MRRCLLNRICKRSDGKLWVLGEGSYGKVWKAVWTKRDGTQADVAMKMTIISPGGHKSPVAPLHKHPLCLPARTPAVPLEATEIRGCG